MAKRDVSQKKYQMNSQSVSFVRVPLAKLFAIERYCLRENLLSAAKKGSKVRTHTHASISKNDYYDYGRFVGLC